MIIFVDYFYFVVNNVTDLFFLKFNLFSILSNNLVLSYLLLIADKAPFNKLVI